MTFDRMNLIPRIFDQVDARNPDLADEPVRRPAAFYTDVERFRGELDQQFLRYPICVGYTGELREPGDYKTLVLAGVPLIVIRGSDGEVRVFHNACRHRGAQLLTADHGNARKRFSCPFHGWNYDNQGNLAMIPAASCFPGVDTATEGLKQVPSQERYGMVFARVGGGEAVDVERHLGPELAAELDRYGWAAQHMAGQDRATVKSNWKIIVDTFGENYHVPYLHTDTLFPLTLAPSMCVDTYGPHIRMAFGMQSITELRDQPELWPTAEIGKHLFVAYLVFPNLVLAAVDGAVAAFQILPGSGPGESHVVHTKLVDPGIDPEFRSFVEGFIDYNWTGIVSVQDLPIAEGIWRSLAAGSCTEFIVGRNEKPVQHFHRSCDDVLAGVLSGAR